MADEVLDFVAGDVIPINVTLNRIIGYEKVVLVVRAGRTRPPAHLGH
jgi:hypothetical protein